MTSHLAEMVNALFAIGMGIVFVIADRQSPTSRALALFLNCIGVATLVGIQIGYGPDDQRLGWARLSSFTEAACWVVGFEWILRVGRTGVLRATPDVVSARLTRLSQGIACVYGLVGVLFPDIRLDVYATRFLEPPPRPADYLMVVPLWSLWLGVVPIVRFLRAQLDPAERVRLIAIWVATPFFVINFGGAWRPIIFAIGELIFLGGAVRYHILQGQRGQFMGRFLSPEVARMVRERGLAMAMQQTRNQLSVVACDLRGFTAFSETAAPEEVIDLMREYYKAIGAVVSEFGGTIKDFAGDGILTLVGAPIPYDDHAQRAVAMAVKMRDRAAQVLSRWRKLGLNLGLGIGVASGYVTVGAIGEERLEYVAVGPAVNLAARLCERAETGEILVAQRTVGLAGDNNRDYRFQSLDAAELKGFSRPVAISAVIAQCDAPVVR